MAEKDSYSYKAGFFFGTMVGVIMVLAVVYGSIQLLLRLIERWSW